MSVPLSAGLPGSQAPLAIPRIVRAAAPDGYPLAVRVWEAAGGEGPERENDSPPRNALLPRGRVVFLHGIISHGGWYLGSCSHLARLGFEVHFLERRGSGLNALDRGDVDRFETWLSDVEDYLESLGREVPRLLVGISWGGKLAAAVAAHQPKSLEGLGLVCPGLAARAKASPVQRRALRLARRIGLERRRVPIPLRDPALFTDIPAWRRYIALDPLTLRQVTVRFALADLELERYVAEAAERIKAPVLLMLAGRDRIIDNPGCRTYIKRVASADKQLLEYPEAAHTLEFEPQPERFFDDLAAWCGRIAGAGS